MNINYSKKFQKDYEWYLKNLNIFNFDGTDKYINKKGLDIIVPDEKGLTAKECFYLYDSQGIIKSCKEPQLYKQLLKCKGSINLHIKMWAEGRADGTLPLIEFHNTVDEELRCLEWINNQPVYYKDYKTRFGLLDWIIEAVENQKINIIQKQNENLSKRVFKVCV